MRKLLKTSILVFASCFGAFAQANETLTCPSISVTGPAGIMAPNELINYSVSVNSKEKDLVLQYIWSVSNEKIVEGQGTKNIKIKQPSEGCLTVTVEVRGLRADCSNLASESTCIDLPPQATKIDEFSEPFVKINKNRVNEIVRSLQNDFYAQLYIIFRHKEKTSPKTANRKEREISDSLTKSGLAADRISIIKNFGQTESTEFWFVPAGAEPPKIRDN